MKNRAYLIPVLVLLLLLTFSAAAETTGTVRAAYTADWGGEEISGLYTGETLNGVPCGFGLLEAGDRHYIGLWEDGYPSGEGTVYKENGDRESGVFRDGVLYNGIRVTAGRETAVTDGNEAGPEPSGRQGAYIGNRKTRKFHYPDCNSVPEILETNRVELYSREEAIQAGYVPCGRCKP